MRKIAGLSVAVIMLGACGAPDDGVGIDESLPTAPNATAPTTTASPTTAPGTTEPEDEMEPDISDPVLAGMVTEAVDDLASRLSVDPGEVDLVRAEAVTWPDGSLGCPEPGAFYTQAIVEGYQVILEVDSRVYLYHAGGDGAPFLCPSRAPDGGHEFVPPPGIDT